MHARVAAAGILCAHPQRRSFGIDDRTLANLAAAVSSRHRYVGLVVGLGLALWRASSLAIALPIALHEDRSGLDALRAEYRKRTAGYDAVILPTCTNLPPDAARLLDDHDYYVSENLATLRNTRIGNLMGGAALTLPTGLPATGIMFMGAPGSEERLLRLGAAAEAALA